MEIMTKIVNKGKNKQGYPTPTIAFLGDSVTQGCFEVYSKDDGSYDTFDDMGSTYHRYLSNILSLLCPGAPVNIINAGISGDKAPRGLERLERDVLCHHPDLTVVCYGLNDSNQGMENIHLYTDALDKILSALAEAGSEVILLTPNMQNTYLSCHIKDDLVRKMAEMTRACQNNGVMDAYVEASREVAKKHGVKICDVYAKWKKLAERGVDTTELLANYINHPKREMHWLFTYSLIETMME